MGTHWIALYVNGDNESASYNATCFNDFGVEHNSKGIKNFIKTKMHNKSVWNTSMEFHNVQIL